MRTTAAWSSVARLLPAILATLPASSCGTTFHEVNDNGTTARTGELVRGDQQGPWTYYFPSGARHAAGEYRDDIQVGPWTYWFENGQKEMEGAFEDELRVGVWTFWHENGRLRARGRFERGFEEGLWEFFAPDGHLERRGRFERGRAVLTWRFTRTDGSIVSEGAFFEGKKVGVWRSAGEGGALVETLFPLPDGIEHCIERWESGAARREGFRRSDRAIGAWVSWHENGGTRVEAQFEGGFVSGPVRTFHSDGTAHADARAERGALVDIVLADGERQSMSSRPAAVWSGSWSPSKLSREASPAIVVEAWIAELSSPIDPQASRVTKIKPTSGAAAVPAALELEPARDLFAPARPQPWTVREEAELPRYLENYGTGPRAGTLTDARYEDPEWWKRSDGDVQRSRALVGRPLPRTRFPTADGGTLDLEECRGRPVVLSVMRGFGGAVCVYCAAQTEALARSAGEFERMGAEIVVMYPGSKAGLDAFLDKYARTFGGERPPYRIVYDSDLQLTSALGIEEKLALPTSMILDADGLVRFAYVGQNKADRPPAARLLEELERLGSRSESQR